MDGRRRIVVIALASALILCQGNAEQVVSPLPMVFAAGTPFSVGYAQGQTFSKQINEYFELADLWNNVLMPLYHTPRGKEVVSKYIDTNCAYYPAICEEVRGIAAGSNNTFEHMMLLQLQEDLHPLYPSSMMRGTQGGAFNKGCSDVQVRSPMGLFAGHNEDADDVLRNRTYIVSAKYLDERSGRTAKITSFNYAGVLANAFGFNSHGITMSINTLYLKHEDVQLGGLGTWFVTRDILNANSLEDAIRRASPPNIANGFSLNLGSVKDGVLMNIEVSPSGPTTTQVAGDDYALHFNMYLHSPRVSQLQSASSIHRRKRALEIVSKQGGPTKPSDILSILGDTQDKDFPIYRRATNTDPSTTLATALFDLTKQPGSLQIFTNNPDQEPGIPVATMTIMDN